MDKRSTLQNKRNHTKKDKDDLKSLYKETNKEIRKCYENHRLQILERCIENTRSAKKAYKELDISKSWITSSIYKSRTDIINVASDFCASLYSSPDSVENIQQNLPKNTFTVHNFDEIEKLKLNKSPGPDNIDNEHIKQGRKLLLTPLTILFNKILEEESVPQQWIILLYYRP
ncbi:hypothetical protein ACJJTC_007544 [Scirpophaga incertulas]